ncbi:MAG TPA: tryptophan synthase subunit alpha [Thermoanaerobaculia bacterium]|jgi:tryptophan synthase alpha chain|nr:tryptophan synthase subunit alpha [Thermoanaerobaculia bacterium]
MNRVKKLFKELRGEHRCGVIAYVTCGDPDVAATPRIVEELVRAGADAIELGVPFSDPIADGPVIQAASQRALERGATIRDLFAIARTIREHSQVPLIAFSYLNPVMRYGTERFATDAAEAGIDGVLLTDLPPEEAEETFREKGLASTFLLAPTSSDKRIAAVDRASDAFVYYVSTTGVTGARSELDPMLLERLVEIREKLKKPIAVGFGISRHEHYELLRDKCDAIVVGSAIVRAIHDGDPAEAPRRAGDIVRAILDNAPIPA